MRTSESKTAAPTAIGDGGVLCVVAPNKYANDPNSSTDFAVAVVARRYRLTAPVARVVCHLAGIGGPL